MILDFHTHWLPEELAKALRARNQPPCIMERIGSEQFMMPVGTIPYDTGFSDLSARLAFMDQHAITTQVLSLPCLFGIDTCPVQQALPLVRTFNDATANAAQAHPGRFEGFAALPFDDMALAAQEYRRARLDLGLLGAIVPINYFLSVNHVNTLSPLLETAQRIGGHLFLHPGRRADEVADKSAAGTDRYPDNIMPRRQLEIQHQVAEAMVTLLWGDVPARYPDITWHVANMGGTLPLVIERMDQTSRLRTHEVMLPSTRARATNVMVDCASMGPAAITAAVACFGAENILFGSDHPIYRADEMLRAVDQAAISEADKQAIRFENGEKLLPNPA